MRSIILLIFLIFSIEIHAKQLKVAVLDTGMPVTTKLPYCSSDHADFTGTGLYDTDGHGTNVAALIAREAKGVNFCIISVKYYGDPSRTLENLLLAINYAIDQNVDIINISGGGRSYDRSEALAVQKALNKGIKVFAAAGNDSKDFSQSCDFYPACYDDRIIAVGCMDESFAPCRSSNFGGKIKTVFIGKNQKGSEGIRMTGTSQATAVASGTYLKVLDLMTKRK